MNGKKCETKVIDNILHKQCSTCLEFKTLDNFYPHKKYFLGLQHWCKKCFSEYSKKRNTTEKNRIDHLKVRHGLSLEDYDNLLRAQGNKCAICFQEYEKYDVDHCHTTGRIRGVLCSDCNKGLGYFNDDIFRLKSAVEYLLSKGI